MPGTASTIFDALGFSTAGSSTVIPADSFGGIWDGAHDIDVPLNQAIAAAVATGGEVSLPAGTFTLAAPITASGGFTLRGRGTGTVLKVSSANTRGNGYLLSLSSISNVLIADLVFDGGGESSAQANPLTQLFRTTNVTLRNITWQNCGGIGLNASGANQTKIENPIVNKVGNRWKSTASGADCHQGLSLTNGDLVTWGFDNTITGGKFTDVGLDHINLGSLTRTTILNNKFFCTNSQATLVGASAIYVGLCASLTISDNIVISATGNGIDIVDSSNLVIRGNTVIGSAGCGIGLFHPNTNTVAFTGSISGTTLTVPAGTAVAIGMALTNAVGAATAVTSGTYITAGSGTTWTVSKSQSVSSEALLAGQNIRSAVIANNICKNNNQGVAQTWTGGITIGDGMPDSLVIEGNLLSDDQATPTQAYGLQVASSGNSPAWAVNLINSVVDASNEAVGNVTAAVLGSSLGAGQNFASLTSTGTTALKGSVTNDNAAAGNYGEYLSNTTAGGISATITVTIATPGVVTWTAHGLAALTAVYFSNSGGALPTGITAFVVYYITAGSVTANTFQISTTMANALAGTSIATSGSQSGTQTGHTGAIMASGTPIDVVGIPLPAGDYDVQAYMSFAYGGATSVTIMAAWLSTAGASTLPYNTGSSSITTTGLADGISTFQTAAIVTPQLSMQTPTVRVSLAAPGMVLLAVQGTFSVSNTSCFATIRARRAR